MLDTAMRTMLEEAGGEQVDDPGFISSDLSKDIATIFEQYFPLS